VSASSARGPPAGLSAVWVGPATPPIGPVLSTFAPVRFDVRAENERLRSAQRPVYAMIVIGILALLGFGVVVAIFGAIRGDWFLRGMGIAMGAFGVVMAVKSFRDARRRLDFVEVTAGGARYGMADGTTRERRWADPQLKLMLADYRKSNIIGLRGLRRVPCALNDGPVHGGLSVEALKALRAAALQAGATVIDTTPDAGGRMSLIGKWPEVTRPIGEPPPYD